VRDHFLIPRLVLNELSLLSALSHAAATPTARTDASTARDPVCGMAITASGSSTTPSGSSYSPGQVRADDARRFSSSYGGRCPKDPSRSVAGRATLLGE
jgi:hypothetical protein